MVALTLGFSFSLYGFAGGTAAIELPDAPALVCGVLKQFKEEPSLDIKGLVAIEQLATVDASHVPLLKRAEAYSIICGKMKVGTIEIHPPVANQ